MSLDKETLKKCEVIRSVSRNPGINTGTQRNVQLRKDPN